MGTFSALSNNLVIMGAIDEYFWKNHERDFWPRCRSARKRWRRSGRDGSRWVGRKHRIVSRAIVGRATVSLASVDRIIINGVSIARARSDSRSGADP
jgi:hypothetical protein